MKGKSGCLPALKVWEIRERLKETGDMGHEGAAHALKVSATTVARWRKAYGVAGNKPPLGEYPAFLRAESAEVEVVKLREQLETPCAGCAALREKLAAFEKIADLLKAKVDAAEDDANKYRQEAYKTLETGNRLLSDSEREADIFRAELDGANQVNREAQASESYWRSRSARFEAKLSWWQRNRYFATLAGIAAILLGILIGLGMGQI